MPLKAVHRNHFITGYVHKAYPDVYAALARSMGYDTAAFIKGIEGGVVPTVSQVSRYFHWSGSDDSLEKIRIVPEDIQIQQSSRSVDLPDGVLQVDECGRPVRSTIDELAKLTAAEGINALKGVKSVMYDCIVLGASVSLAGFNGTGMEEASKTVTQSLNSGQAIEVFEALRNQSIGPR